jgi:4'-phosphopantetheinyl transferase
VFELREIDKHIRIGILDLKAFAIENGLSIKRDIEKRGSHYLLKHLLNSEDFELAYSLQNKPFLKGRSEHISISHSHDKLALIINTKEATGIDIELIRDKVINIQRKFLNENELVFANNEVERLVCLWAAKETLYKIYGLKELEFIANLSIDAFDGKEMRGYIHAGQLKKTFLLNQETIENYKLVYALHEL